MAVYPKFELIKAQENENWEVRAISCGLPKVDLGDYKSALKKEITTTIWTPGKDETKKPTQEAKEQKIMKALLASAKVTIPKLLIDQEVDAKLSNLLSQIEKLSLNLETYLTSLGKTPDSLRKEYVNEVIEAISLELILDTIASTEGIKIKEEDVQKTFQALASDPNFKNKTDDPNNRKIVETILKRREVLEKLANL